MVKKRIQIPIRERNNGIGCEVSTHLPPNLDGLIVKIISPTQPVNGYLHHVTCDVVLVIDVSRSMKALAPAPPREKGQKAQQTGLTVPDLGNIRAAFSTKSGGAAPAPPTRPRYRYRLDPLQGPGCAGARSALFGWPADL